MSDATDNKRIVLGALKSITARLVRNALPPLAAQLICRAADVATNQGLANNEPTRGFVLVIIGENEVAMSVSGTFDLRVVDEVFADAMERIKAQAGVDQDVGSHTH